MNAFLSNQSTYYRFKVGISLLFLPLLISCSSDPPVDGGKENIHYGSAVIANDDLGMPLRYRHSLELFDDKLWMFAGLSGGHSEWDIWYSENGINWHLATEKAEFPARVQHTTLVYNDKMWVIGGYIIGGFFKDIWYTDDGTHWIEAADDTPLGRRNSHSSVVFDNKMWVIGGSEISEDFNESYIRNDAWYSTDGVNWAQATDSADFQPRIDHKSVVFDNKIWVIGGRGWNDETGIGEYLHDVWYSENGLDWTLATDDIGIGNISSYRSVVFDGKIWIIGGTPEGGGVSGDIWYSSDGTNWSKATPFFGRVDHAVTVFQDKIWGVGGASQDSSPSDTNDSWYLNLQ